MRRIPEKHSFNQFPVSNRPIFNPYLVISLAQELEFLRLLVHEHPVKVAGLHAPDLDGLVPPAHDLPGPDVGHAGGQLAPLQHDVLGDLEIGGEMLNEM